MGGIVRLDELPKRCFISHSYTDAAAVEKLCRSLPADMELVTFPRAEPDPRQAVSNEIIPKILDCPGLVYLTGGASGHSFWVSFERDYALRSGREVFAYTPASGSIRRDDSSPLNLTLTLMFHRSDEDRVRRLGSWMAKERHFALDESRFRSQFGGFTGNIMLQMEELLIGGGVALWLMGIGNTSIAQAFYSDEFASYLEDNGLLEDLWRDFLARRQHDDGGDEERPDDSADLGSRFSASDFIQNLYSNLEEVFVRIDPDLSSDWLPWRGVNRRMIDLYEGTGDEEFNWNRVDDLIITLYEAMLPRN